MKLHYVKSGLLRVKAAFQRLFFKRAEQLPRNEARISYTKRFLFGGAIGIATAIISLKAFGLLYQAMYLLQR